MSDIKTQTIARTKQMVLDFFEGNEEKTELWFESANPGLGNISANDMISYGRWNRVFLWVRDAISLNESIDEKPSDNKEPTIKEVIDRLHELSDAVTKGRVQVVSEFTMRVPAEPKRDADLVLSKAATMLKALNKENADQEIKLENLKSEIRRLHSVIYDRSKGTYSPIRTRTDSPLPPPSEE